MPTTSSTYSFLRAFLNEICPWTYHLPPQPEMISPNLPKALFTSVPWHCLLLLAPPVSLTSIHSSPATYQYVVFEGKDWAYCILYFPKCSSWYLPLNTHRMFIDRNQPFDLTPNPQCWKLLTGKMRQAGLRAINNMQWGMNTQAYIPATQRADS